MNGFGLGTMVQLFPSKCSMRVRSVWFWALGSLLSPTTHTSFEAMATIPLNQAWVFAGMGTRTAFQRVPSQCAISGFRVEPIWSTPAAHMSVLLTPATAVK